ncbi:MAG: MvaI/BcnI family restriction endonuclease [Chloroflexi bacterium]|nr:MvaI/BcnI family restriction endonuclease [Chloroflexota bacterium]
MIEFPSDPPRNKEQLFDRIRSVIDQGVFNMPAGSRYQGTGAAGMFLEDLLGLTAGSKDIPDAVGWELKWFSNRTCLVTLFHKEANGPKNVMRNMVQTFGWEDQRGRLSFRYTVEGESALFKIKNDDKSRRIIVRPKQGQGPAPFWSYDELIAAAGAKLRRLILVNGEAKKRNVRFLYAEAYETFHLADFVQEILRGSIAIDFDCRQSKPGSAGLRNHGTKFRVSPLTICRLYLKKERL